ncbi:MAG: phosphatase [Actinomycetes bacterium]
MTPAPTRDALRTHLVDTRIAGKVATPRENNLRNFRLMSRRERAFLFGTQPDGRWSFEDVLALMAERCGVSPDPTFTEGVDTIDPDRTLDRLDALADRVRAAAAQRQRVMLATGHPSGLLPVHLATARLLEAAGCTLLTPAAGWRYEVPVRHGPTYREIRYISGVATLHAGGELKHTHSGQPMQAMLAALAEAGEPPPDLVVGDHGWAGAAGQAGVDAVGYADCNDPALFVAEAEGKVAVAVPLDDNVEPHLYDPLVAYLVARATP